MADPQAAQRRLEAAPITKGDVFDVLDLLTFDDISDNIDGSTKGKDEILHKNSANRLETDESYNNIGEVVDEEIVELEFDKVQPKLVTHSMHCPICKYEVAKVVLRRKNLKLEDPRSPEPVEYMNQESIISSAQVQICKYVTGDLKLEEPQQQQPLYVNRQSIINFHQVQPPKSVTKTTSVATGTFRLLFSDDPESSNASRDDNASEPETIGVVEQSRRRSWLGYEGILAQILKSIVYGGLMEVIASLSIVVSAATSGATTLIIVSLALASLIGGVFIFAHNLWDLRGDCYKNSSSQDTKKATTYKYKELLGQVNYFPLHAFFAILSFLVFGMAPPVTYKYSYHETKDRDITLVVVATVSLLCVLLLASLKAYINKCTVLKYFKTVVYYIIIAVLASGVSYVVGHLFSRLIKELGWFNTSSGGVMPCLPHATNPYLETF